MHTEPGATSQLDCRCPAGTFVFGWDSTSYTQECRGCDSDRQLCDEPHQIIPKPSGPGIWINPDDGSAHDCIPYIACIEHTEEEDVLLGTCSHGYQVHSREPLDLPDLSRVPLRRALTGMMISMRRDFPARSVRLSTTGMTTLCARSATTMCGLSTP